MVKYLVLGLIKDKRLHDVKTKLTCTVMNYNFNGLPNIFIKSFDG